MGVKVYLGGPLHAQHVPEERQGEPQITWARVLRELAHEGRPGFLAKSYVYVRRDFLNIMTEPPLPGLEGMRWAVEAGFRILQRTPEQMVTNQWPVRAEFWVYDGLCPEGATTLAKDFMEEAMIRYLDLSRENNDRRRTVEIVGMLPVTINGVPQVGLSRLAAVARAASAAMRARHAQGGEVPFRPFRDLDPN